jgi:hypothetical protein
VLAIVVFVWPFIEMEMFSPAEAVPQTGTDIPCCSTILFVNNVFIETLDHAAAATPNPAKRARCKSFRVRIFRLPFYERYLQAYPLNPQRTSMLLITVSALLLRESRAHKTPFLFSSNIKAMVCFSYWNVVSFLIEQKGKRGSTHWVEPPFFRRLLVVSCQGLAQAAFFYRNKIT